LSTKIYKEFKIILNIVIDNIVRTSDKSDYPSPAQICLQLSHKDVVLDYFAYRRRDIDFLKSGDELLIQDMGCFFGDKQVLKFSTKFCEQIESLKSKGYSPVKTIIRHLVFWQGKDKEKEIKIILPDIEFRRCDSGLCMF
jgi:ATP-dependent DNA helicase RecQ